MRGRFRQACLRLRASAATRFPQMQRLMRERACPALSRPKAAREGLAGLLARLLGDTSVSQVRRQNALREQACQALWRPKVAREGLSGLLARLFCIWR